MIVLPIGGVNIRYTLFRITKVVIARVKNLQPLPQISILWSWNWLRPLLYSAPKVTKGLGKKLQTGNLTRQRRKELLRQWMLTVN